jgi:uncharacterized membrane protein YqjE
MAQGNGHADQRERPVGELLRELSEQTTRLVKQELELANAELGEKGRKAGAGAGMLGGAGILGLLSAGALTACLIAALDTAVALWLAALIVAAVYGAIAGILALSGRNRVQEAAPPIPEQTVDNVKEDVQWAKTRATSASR